jgi:hypothetical protein
MFLTRDIINKISGSYTQPDIYIICIIYASKSFLDSIAMTLNHVYALKLKRGNIDLKECLSLKRLQETETESQTSLLIEQEIRSRKDWILQVVEWRDPLIHRSITSISHSEDPHVLQIQRA